MANLAEKHDEEENAQLADSEVSRILSALQKAEFKRSETGNERPDLTFKPRSLMEIAETARQQDEAAKAAAITAETVVNEATHAADEAIDDTVDDMAVGSGDAPTDDKATEPAGDNPSNGQQSAGILGSESQDTGPEIPQAESNAADPRGLTATDAEEAAGADFDNGAGSAPSTSPFETAQAAYDRGYGDGLTAGRESAEAEFRATIEAEFEAKFADKINAFENALTALAQPQTVDTRNLSASLQAAVVRLAAARTGAAIDQLPELMVTRIENLADAAGKNISKGHVFMHPDDCSVIAPIMETRQSQVKIEPDPELFRGDIRIRFDGMDISDIAELRADWQISQSTAHDNIAKGETSQAKISDAEFETRAPNNSSLDPQDASAQSSINSPPLQDGEKGRPMPDENKDNGDACPSDSIGLMPLTTTGGDNSASDVGAGNEEDASSSDSIGLMPLTSKNIDE